MGRITRTIALLMAALFVMVAGRLDRAADDAPPPATQPADAGGDEGASGGPMTRLGEQLIAGLPKIDFGYSHESHLEAKGPDGKPFATSRTTVIAEGAGEKLRYHYTDVSIVRDPEMKVVEFRTDGYLDRRFRPISIDWEIINQDANGWTTTEREKLVVGDETTVYSKTDASGKTEEKRYPTPKETFVYFMGELMRRLPVEPGQRFILRDLDPETGSLTRRTYHVYEKDGGTRISIRKHPSKVETEYFRINERGWIEKHAIHELGLTFEASSDARVKAIENVFRRFRRGEKPAP